MANRSNKLTLRNNPRWDAWLDRVAPLLEGVNTLISSARALATQVRESPLNQVGQRVQRFGGTAWDNISARWPALAELVRDRGAAKRVSVRYQKPAQVRRVAQRSGIADAVLADSHGELDGSTVTRLLAELATAAAWEVRANAASQLTHASADGVVPALVTAMRDVSVEVAVAAIEALSAQPDDRAVDALLAVLENVDGYFNPVTRVAAITGLARRLDVARFDPVFAALRDIDAEVSIAAAAVIADRVPDRAGPLLLPILRDKSGYYLPIVRLAVANALERTGALHGGIASDLLANEQDPSVQRVLERAQYLAAP